MPTAEQLQNKIKELTSDLEGAKKNMEKRENALKKEIKQRDQMIDQMMSNAEKFVKLEKHCRNIVCAHLPPRDQTSLDSEINLLRAELGMEYQEMITTPTRP